MQIESLNVLNWKFQIGDDDDGRGDENHDGPGHDLLFG